MKLLLTSAGINNTSIHNALVDLLGKPIAESSALCIPTASTPTPCGAGHGLAVHQRRDPPPCANWVGSPWACWSSPRCPASRRVLGPRGPGDGRPAGGWRRSPVSVLLDAAVRTGRPLAVAARDGLRGTERREHGDGPQHRGGLRRWKPPTGCDERWAWLILRCFRTWITRICRTIPWPTPKQWAAGMTVPAYAIDDQTAIKWSTARRSRLRRPLETVYALRGVRTGSSLR